MSAPLQNPLQAAVVKLSRAQDLAARAIEITDAAGEYMYASDLAHKPTIAVRYKTPHMVSYILSDAYRQGLIGRKHEPRGREKFVYGPLGPKADAPRRVIKGPEKKLVGYAITHRFVDGFDALDHMAKHGGSVEITDGEYLVTIRYDTALAALRSLVYGNENLSLTEVFDA